MTVDTEWAKRFQRMEYILCVEGVGWVKDLDTSNGFDAGSVVWSTGDIDGTSASDLGSITVHEGLSIGGSITEELNPETMEHKVGGMTFTVTDHSGWWLSNFTPRKTSTPQALSADLDYYKTTLNIDDGSGYAEGDEIWLGHRELVRLGTKAVVSGTEYTFTGSTRGHKGTRRGSALRGPGTTGSYLWPDETTTNTVGRFWLNRRVALWAHVPGEAAASMELLWVGRIGNINVKDSGVDYRIGCNGDWLGDINSKPQWQDWIMVGNDIWKGLDRSDGVLLRPISKRVMEFFPGYGPLSDHTAWKKYAMALWYHYRWEPGGTDGAVTDWDNSDVSVVQAVQRTVDGASRDLIQEFAIIDNDGIFNARWMRESPTSATPAKWFAEFDPVPVTGGESTWSYATDEPGSAIIARRLENRVPARFLLSLWHNDYTKNRFQVNKVVSDNPIDVALCFMMSGDGEYEVFNCNASSTTTDIRWTGTGRATSLYAGKAIFAVEDDNRYTSRIISTQDTADIVPERAFDNTPASGEEYQIRESIYDCLPAGWGMGMRISDVDVDSFLDVKNKHMASAKIDRFILGTESFDIWELLVENIFKPYNILVYLDRSTGKITARYVGDIASDGITETLTSLDTDNVYRVGDTSWNFQPPIGKVTIKVRKTSESITRATKTHGESSTGIGVSYETIRTAGKIEDEQEIIIRPEQFDSILHEGAAEDFTMSAILSTVETAEDLIQRAYGILARYALPIAVIDLDVDMALYNSMQVGAHCIIDDLPHVANPNTGSRGLTGVIGRVVATKFDPRNPVAFNCKLELFETINLAKIAPAADLAGSLNGSDGTSDWFEVSADSYVADTDSDSDLEKFVVGDRICVKDNNGAPYDGNSSPWTVYTIRSFGANDVADPASASSNIIRVNETISSTGSLASGDYVTFAPWVAANTARMEGFAAFSAAAGTLTPSDAGREYASG